MLGPFSYPSYPDHQIVLVFLFLTITIRLVMHLIPSRDARSKSLYIRDE